MNHLGLKKVLPLIVCIILAGCSGGVGSRTVKVVKPKGKNRLYDPKKDKKAKRTKTIRMKS